MFEIVKNLKIIFEEAQFYYKGQILEENCKITEENFVLIWSNIELIILNYLRKILNLN